MYTFNKWYTLSDEIKKTNSILQLLHGNVVAMTDQNREVVATYEYDSWGNVLKSDVKGIAADNPFGYAGYMYDKEIGMYYLIARYYNPEHGVFLSVDPDPGDEDDPITMNGYTYGDNNPVMKVDPDGHYAIALAAAGTNFWNPVGWVIAGGLAIYGGIKYISLPNQIIILIRMQGLVKRNKEEKIKRKKRKKVGKINQTNETALQNLKNIHQVRGIENIR
ncbi:RHS repeat domain-containing protein [Bacillus thuringiensis]|uniref:RHS repeat domain-containing protein n=1 Tax=Bacillus thuringiensis TaxID=1428 RepID=UPI001F0A642E|nr:RHS repeat-associated core domain-containing protein [Bacillus thuringiensis]